MMSSSARIAGTQASWRKCLAPQPHASLHFQQTSWLTASHNAITPLREVHHFRRDMAPPVAPAAGATDADVRDQSALEQRLGQSTSVIMPLLELGAIGYVTWVLVYQICVQYLIDPSAKFRQDFNVQPRRATGIALIVVYAVLLLLLLVPWSRLIQVIWSKPDVTPLGNTELEKKEVTTSWLGEYDAYICDYEGMPLWCDKCHNWKPDRTHHCKELGRCVKKMDHYCPWAGGIIAETTHKFFMQFVFFGSLYTAYCWIVTAVFLGERISKVCNQHLQQATWGQGMGVHTDSTADWITSRYLDRCARYWNPFLHLHLHHELHDRLEPLHQLHIRRRHSARRRLQHRLSDRQQVREIEPPINTIRTG